MTDEQLAMAKRLVATEGFEWLDGMLDHTGYRLISQTPTPSVWQLGRESCLGSLTGIPSLPDISDPATAGLLPVLARRAWQRPDLCAIHWRVDGDMTRWMVTFGGMGLRMMDGARYVTPDTEQEAWIRALELAPAR